MTPPLAHRARRAAAALGRHWPRPRVVDVELPGGHTLRWCRDDRYPAAMVDGSYEPGVVERLHALVAPGDHVLDLGANSGYLSFAAKAFAGPTGRVVAVEPHPTNLATISRRQRLNPGLPVEVVAAAVAPREGEVVLHCTRNLANSRIQGGGWSHEKPAVDEVVVAARTLDHLIGLVAPQVVKIDIEGAEGPVLDASAGPSAWVTRPVLLVEYHGPDNRERCADAAERWGWTSEDEPAADGLPGGLLTLWAPT